MRLGRVATLPSAAATVLARGWRIAAVRAVCRIAWVVGLGLLLLPPPLYIGGGLLDSSWYAGLVLAHRSSLHFGSDVLWTYGPLGYLNLPYYYFFREWLEATAAEVAVHFLFLIVVALQLSRARASAGRWVLVTVVLLLPSNVIGSLEFALLFSVILLLHISIIDERRSIALPAAVTAGALGGLSALVKGTDLFQGSATILLAAVIAAASGRRREAGAAVAGFAGALAALWFATGQRVDDVAPYLRGVLEIARGYSAALGVKGGNGATLTALILGLAVAAIAALAWFQGDRRLAVLGALLLPVTAVTFRDDFVRAGDRQYDFFSLLVFVFGMLAIHARSGPAVSDQARPRTATPDRAPSRGAAPDREPAHPARGGPATRARPTLAIGAGLVATGALVAQSSLDFPLSTVNARRAALTTALHTIRHPDAARALTAQVQAIFATQYAIDSAVLDTARSGTIDVYPTDIDAVFAYGLRWSPRPLLQAYQSDDTDLDARDAAHFSGTDRPDHVLYAYASVDDRYALFDEPQTTRALLEGWDVRVATGRTEGAGAFLLLEHRTSTAAGGDRDEGRVCGELGAAIAVPNVAGRYVYGRVTMSRSLWGELENLVFKTGDADVSFELSSGQRIPPRRFVPATATGGVFVSGWIGDEDDMSELFAGNVVHPVRSMTFDSPNRSDYASEVCVDFFSRPIP